MYENAAAGRFRRRSPSGVTWREAIRDPTARSRLADLVPDRPNEPFPPVAIRALERLADECTLADARRLRRRLHGLRAVPDDRRPEAFSRWRDEFERARARRSMRLASVPTPTYPDLPVAARREEIIATIRTHQVVVLCGDTGSGKSTQLPKMCLEAGRGVAGTIAHTQPRRIAARSVGARVAEELGLTVGGIVGVKTRFDDRTSPSTLLALMTDGILLAETRHDRDLLAYDTIIVDEAHERSLNIDFLLGYLTRLLQRRSELKLIITSATIDPERFSAHFGRAPIIMVEGRTYPIETRWHPVEAATERDEEDPDILAAILLALDEIDQSPRASSDARTQRKRDVLIFLSGEREIRETAEALKGRARDTDVLPLYARLSGDEQDRVFKPGAKRRIVLATNVAETSITVPGIDAVIDPGLARISRYSPRGRVQRLPIEAIAQSSADQRRGRCGRTAPGLCIRLYAEDEFVSRPRFTQPEILRTNLASVILQMASLSLGRPEEFPFLDPPSQRLILAGYETLVELGAVTKRHELTSLGRRMAILPVDPRLSRMILASLDERCLAEVLVIVAALSVQDPRERPAEKAAASDFAQAEFRDERSDFLGFVKLWKAWRAKSEELGSSALRRWCRERFLSWLRMREWSDVFRQLRELVRERIAPTYGDVGLAVECDANAVHRSLLAGLVANVGKKGEKNDYRSAAGSEFFLHPSSVLAKKTPPWIMSAEIVETSRRFARICAKVQSDWLEKVAPHLCQRAFSEPHWLKDAGQVAAWERVSMGDLTIVPRRRVPFGPVDAAGARDIFIQSALVEGELRTQGTFLAHNANLRAAIEMLEAKGRSASLLVDSDARFAFYDARVPNEIHSGPSFEKWRKESERRDPAILAMRPEDLLRPGAANIEASRFPDVLVVDDFTLPLAYRHAPGAADDGVTLKVPVAAAQRVDPERLEWLVPGLLEEKIAGILRTLPKRLRVRFQPAAEFASGAAESIAFGQGKLVVALARHLTKLTGVALDARDFDLTTMSPHLRMRIEVTDRDGKLLAQGRDASEVLGRFRDRAQADVRKAAESTDVVRSLVKRGLKDWTIADLPEVVRFDLDGLPFVGYPCLADEGESVAVRVVESRDEAMRLHRGGIRRLLAIRVASALSHHIEFLPNRSAMALAFAPLGSRRSFERSLADLAIDLGFLGSAVALPRTGPAFDALAASGDDRLFEASCEAAKIAEPILRARQDTATALDGQHPAPWGEALDRMRADLARLAPPDVLTATDLERLRHLPRYLAAIRSRLRRLPGNVDRDAREQEAIDAWTAKLAEVPAGAEPAAVARFRLLIEEFQVQRFAGELRTAVPVSAERLAAAWEKLREEAVA